MRRDLGFEVREPEVRLKDSRETFLACKSAATHRPVPSRSRDKDNEHLIARATQLTL